MKGNRETIWKILEGHAGTQARHAAVMAEPGPGGKSEAFQVTSAPPLPWAVGTHSLKDIPSLTAVVDWISHTITGKAVRTMLSSRCFQKRIIASP